MAVSGSEYAQTAYDVAVSSTGINDDRAPVIPYDREDCQAFVEDVLRRLGIKKNWSGSNAIWRDLAWRGTPEEARKTFGSVPVGSLIFIWTENTSGCKEKYKKDGQGNASHVGIYTNKGKGAAHSSSIRKGVCQSVFKGKTIPNGGWNRVGLLKQLDYGDRVARILNDAADEKELMDLDTIAVVTSDNGAGVRFRSAKNTKASSVITNIPEGENVLVLDDDGTWSTCDYEGKTGYIMSKYLVDVGSPAVSDGEIQLSLDRPQAETLYAALRKALGVE